MMGVLLQHNVLWAQMYIFALVHSNCNDYSSNVVTMAGKVRNQG